MALKLLGNASGHTSTERRKNILTNLNLRLTDMADEDGLYKNAVSKLFGEGFSKKAKERDDDLKVLRSARPQTDKRQLDKGPVFLRKLPLWSSQEGWWTSLRRADTLWSEAETVWYFERKRGGTRAPRTLRAKEAKDCRRLSRSVFNSTSCISSHAERKICCIPCPVHNCKAVDRTMTDRHSSGHSPAACTSSRKDSVHPTKL